MPKGKEWDWLSEYWAGKSYEIYRVSIPKLTFEKPFNEISNYIYKTYKSILFAIEIVERGCESGPILLNPGNFTNQFMNKTKIKFDYYGYVISDSLEEAEKLFMTSDDPKDMANADKYLNLGVVTSHAEHYVRQNSAHRMLKYGREVSDSSDDDKLEEVEEDDENELDVENLEGDWIHFCHLTQNPVKLEDIKFPTLKDSKLAKDHIIICGIVENIRGFIIPLRALYLKKIAPIVIFNEEEPSQQLWSQLSSFPQVYFVRGSALKESDLERINLDDAKQVVILSPNLNRNANDAKNSGKTDSMLEGALKVENRDDDFIKEKKEKEEENLMDAQTIFKYNIIKKRHKNVRIITELYSHQNLAYLDDPSIYHVMNEYGYDQTPIFAAGEVYSSSLMDSLICQA